jgi:hypothetical protein
VESDAVAAAHAAASTKESAQAKLDTVVAMHRDAIDKAEHALSKAQAHLVSAHHPNDPAGNVFAHDWWAVIYRARPDQAIGILNAVKTDSAVLDCGGSGVGRPPPGPVGQYGLPVGYTVPRGLRQQPLPLRPLHCACWGSPTSSARLSGMKLRAADTADE